MVASGKFDQGFCEGFKQYASTLRGKTFCITGSTGLVGSSFVRSILRANDVLGLDCRLVLPARSQEKVLSFFGSNNNISFYDWDLFKPFPDIQEHIDYVIHAASPTASSFFITNPVETMQAIESGAATLLEFCRNRTIDKIVFLSTMEVYGETNGIVAEEDLGLLDPMVIRNCYPIAKKMVECLCASYMHEYDVPCCVLRLAQTFGEGVPYDDGRVFAEFARCVLQDQDIVLLTDGQKKNVYLSLKDASNAILTLLVKGVPGEAYNAANPLTYCSIVEMAKGVINRFGSSKIEVRFACDPEKAKMFRKSSELNLDISKLSSLGWTPQQDLTDMYSELFETWQKLDRSLFNGS